MFNLLDCYCPICQPGSVCGGALGVLHNGGTPRAAIKPLIYIYIYGWPAAQLTFYCWSAVIYPPVGIKLLFFVSIYTVKLHLLDRRSLFLSGAHFFFLPNFAQKALCNSFSFFLGHLKTRSSSFKENVTFRFLNSDQSKRQLKKDKVFNGNVASNFTASFYVLCLSGKRTDTPSILIFYCNTSTCSGTSDVVP